MKSVVIHWFRRDLRLEDNHAFFKALKSDLPVLPLFIFDKAILKELPSQDARVQFIHDRLEEMNRDLAKHNSSIRVFHGDVLSSFKELVKEFDVKKVFTNEDYEPQAIERDLAIEKFLKSKDIEFQSFKDQVIFHKDEVVKPDGKPYNMFTPYARKWHQVFKMHPPENYLSERHLKNCVKRKFSLPSLKNLGFEKSSVEIPKLKIDKQVLKNYARDRNFPAFESTTRIGLHLRFGTVSVRHAVSEAKISPTWLIELIWREFFMMILFHYPHTVSKPARELAIEWRQSKADFKKWQEGMTGYPLVDAGMRQLKETGFMHNRPRLVVASFLCKHLLLPWKWGERHFAELLLDFELSNNIGNWQWSAGTGFDAAPYFRIFNPTIAVEKFDKEEKYVRQWVPEYGTKDYPEPMVEHEFARRRALENYAKAKKIKRGQG